MCGRATLTQNKKALEKRFRARFVALDEDHSIVNYNVAPTQLHPVITNEQPGQLQLFKWGLIPFWAKDAKIGSRMINSRLETITEKPSFRTAVKRRRCIIPFDGFYEWKKIGKKKQPHRIVMKDRSLFAMAGIWEKWKDPETEKLIYSFSIITQPPNELLASIHDRMPAILTADTEQQWISPDLSTEAALDLIQPLDSDLLEAYPVSVRVNRASENDKELIEPIPLEI